MDTCHFIYSHIPINKNNTLTHLFHTTSLFFSIKFFNTLPTFISYSMYIVYSDYLIVETNKIVPLQHMEITKINYTKQIINNRNGSFQLVSTISISKLYISYDT